MGKYDHITDEMFDKELARVIRENWHELLSIPGAYEIFAEYYNNLVLERLERYRPKRSSC